MVRIFKIRKVDPSRPTRSCRKKNGPGTPRANQTTRMLNNMNAAGIENRGKDPLHALRQTSTQSDFRCGCEYSARSKFPPVAWPGRPSDCRWKGSSSQLRSVNHFTPSPSNCQCEDGQGDPGSQARIKETKHSPNRQQTEPGGLVDGFWPKITEAAPPQNPINRSTPTTPVRAKALAQLLCKFSGPSRSLENLSDWARTG